MPRGSRYLDEPALYIHPETGQRRNATTKIEAVSYEADGFRPAAEVHAAEDAAGEAEDAAIRSEAAKKAAATRRRNAKEAAAKSGAQAARTTATESTESNVDSAE